MTASNHGLADIPTMLDLARHKYNVGQVKLALPAAAVVECHAGTSLPKRIVGLSLAAGTVVYRQQWHCCGGYRCSSGNGKDSARRKCSAVAVLTIESTDADDEFRVLLDEPDAAEHGADYEAPPDDGNVPRTLYRTKVAMADAAARGLSYAELIGHLPKNLRPVVDRDRKATKAFRRRYENQRKKTVVAAVPKRKVRRLTVASSVPNEAGTESDDDDVAAAAAAALVLANMPNERLVDDCGQRVRLGDVCARARRPAAGRACRRRRTPTLSRSSASADADADRPVCRARPAAS
jgi:hypothetical protein